MAGTLPKLVEALGRRQAIDRLADPLQRAVTTAFAAGGGLGRRAQDLLNGVWLGHPLHPVLTDLPIGFWTATVALDTADALRGRDDLSAAADLALGLGLGTALVTALSGFADWQFTQDRPRRIGTAHAMMNLAVTALNALALVIRRAGARKAGRSLTLAGYLVLNAAGYLGGHLVSENRIGVDHASGQPLPAEFVAVLAEQELIEGQPKRAEAGGTAIVLVRQGGRIFALADTCAHLGGPLSEGSLQDGGIVCPWHGSRFDLLDGRPLNGPSAFPQPALETRVTGGQIEVRRAGGDER